MRISGRSAFGTAAPWCSGDDLAVTFDCAAVTRDTTPASGEPAKDRHAGLERIRRIERRAQADRLLRMHAFPGQLGENQVDGDPNKFSLKATATSVPKVNLRQS